MKVTTLGMWLKRIATEWKKYNQEFVLPPDTSRIELFTDYIYCVLKYRITYSEYFEQYRFYLLNKQERNEFITMSQAHRIQRDLNRGVRDLFWYKDRFLNRFSS